VAAASGPADLLLTLLAEEGSFSSRLLAEEPATIDAARSLIKPVAGVDAVVDAARREAHALGHAAVGTEHLLIALLEKTPALAAAGLSAATVRTRAFGVRA
jgi:hypothetical protein